MPSSKSYPPLPSGEDPRRPWLLVRARATRVCRLIVLAPPRPGQERFRNQEKNSYPVSPAERRDVEHSTCGRPLFWSQIGDEGRVSPERLVIAFEIAKAVQTPFPPPDMSSPSRSLANLSFIISTSAVHDNKNCRSRTRVETRVEHSTST